MCEPSQIGLALFRFGLRSHLEDLRAGLVHMNPLPYFTARESLSASQRDPFEGTDEIYQPKDVISLTFQSNGKKTVIPSTNLRGPVRIGLGRQAPPNVFCMFGLTDPVTSPLVDPRNLDFGDSFVVVLHTEQFAEPIREAAGNFGYQSEFRAVEYFNESDYSGETGPFRKPTRFEYQREWRFALWPGRAGALRLDVGNLKEITTEIMSLRDINDIVTLEPLDAT